MTLAAFCIAIFLAAWAFVKGAGDATEHAERLPRAADEKAKGEP